MGVPRGSCECDGRVIHPGCIRGALGIGSRFVGTLTGILTKNESVFDEKKKYYDENAPSKPGHIIFLIPDVWASDMTTVVLASHQALHLIAPFYHT